MTSCRPSPTRTRCGPTKGRPISIASTRGSPRRRLCGTPATAMRRPSVWSRRGRPRPVSVTAWRGRSWHTRRPRCSASAPTRNTSRWKPGWLCVIDGFVQRVRRPTADVWAADANSADASTATAGQRSPRRSHPRRGRDRAHGADRRALRPAAPRPFVHDRLRRPASATGWSCSSTVRRPVTRHPAICGRRGSRSSIPT